MPDECGRTFGQVKKMSLADTKRRFFVECRFEMVRISIDRDAIID